MFEATSNVLGWYWISATKSADQQVDVFGHDYVAHDDEPTALITTEDDEVKVSGAVESSKTLRHVVMVTSAGYTGCDQ